MQISSAYIFDRATTQMSTATEALSKSQAQIASGKQILNPSDAPDQAAMMARIKATLARQDNYSNALDTLQARLDMESTTLTSASDVLVRIKELAVQVNNGTQGTISRAAIATEMQGLRDQLLSLANTRDTTGNYIFSGSKVGTPAFQADGSGAVSYHGDQTRMNIAVGDQRKLPLNRPGSDAFVRVVRTDAKGIASGIGFFQSIDDLISGVKSNSTTAMQRGLTEMDALHNGVVLAQADAGTSMKVVQQQGTTLDDTKITLKTALSKVEDLDMAAAITQMQNRWCPWRPRSPVLPRSPKCPCSSTWVDAGPHWQSKNLSHHGNCDHHKHFKRCLVIECGNCLVDARRFRSRQQSQYRQATWQWLGNRYAVLGQQPGRCRTGPPAGSNQQEHQEK